MKLPKVIDVKDVRWICFKKLMKWEYPFIKHFAYEDISNKEIDAIKDHPCLMMVQLEIEWQDEFPQLFLPLDYHCLRIRRFVDRILSGGAIEPIILDTYSRRDCGFCIPDGHHRIRALQYLKYSYIPAYCSGLIQEIDLITESPKHINDPSKFYQTHSKSPLSANTTLISHYK